MINKYDLINEITMALFDIKNQIGQKGRHNCRYELRYLTDLIQQFSAPIPESVNLKTTASVTLLINNLEEMITLMDLEIPKLEIEMQGVMNYTDYQRDHLKIFEDKRTLRDELVKLIQFLKQYEVTTQPEKESIA